MSEAADSLYRYRITTLCIAVADTTRVNLYPNLTRSALRYNPLDELERSACFFNVCCPHK